MGTRMVQEIKALFKSYLPRAMRVSDTIEDMRSWSKRFDLEYDCKYYSVGIPPLELPHGRPGLPLPVYREDYLSWLSPTIGPGRLYLVILFLTKVPSLFLGYGQLSGPFEASLYPWYPVRIKSGWSLWLL